MDISIEKLSVAFPSEKGETLVLRPTCLTWKEGEILALVGESGSGKSILGAAIAGLLPKEAEIKGKILYGDKDLLKLNEDERNEFRRTTLGWIAQDPVSALDPIYKVGRQVAEAFSFLHKPSKAEAKEKAVAQLGKFGFSEPESIYPLYPSEMSGGMAQRALTAMMTMTNPSMIIADEPTKGLDAFVRKQVADNFRKLKNQGTGILLITHDLHLARNLSDSMAVLYAGEILEQGRTEDIFASPQHPYTRGLLAADPRRGLHPIEGKPPAGERWPEEDTLSSYGFRKGGR